MSVQRHPSHTPDIYIYLSYTFSTAFSLPGKLALITGGGSGIGFDIARCRGQAGATVVITGRREQPLQEAVATLGVTAPYITGASLPVDGSNSIGF